MSAGDGHAERRLETLVCFAIKEEAGPFRTLAGGRPEFRLLVTGIGRGNAGRALQEALRERPPQRILTCGFAGGLDPALSIGAVLFETGDPELKAKLAAAGAQPGTFCCAARVAVSAAEKEQLRRSTGADAVEMESEAIQAICRDRGIPCATVRSISDRADEDLPLDFNELFGLDFRLDYARLAAQLLRSPGKIPSLLKLQRKSRVAARALAQVLARALTPQL